MDDELHRFKTDIHLTQYALDRRGYRFVRHESSIASHVLIHLATHDKIIVRRDLDRHWTYFSVRDGTDNGTIVDFEQRRGHHRTFGELRRDLRAHLGLPAPASGWAIAPPRPAAPTDLTAVREAFESGVLLPSSSYLESRGLTRETLSDPRFAATWRLGPRGNVLFAHRDDQGVLTGFEIKNRGFTGFATGGAKTAWQSRRMPDDRELVVTEAVIDSLSYHELHPRGASTRAYVSTAGAPGTRQLEVLDRIFAALPERSVVVAATDHDAGGDQLAGALERLAARHAHLAYRRHAPALDKDWNDQLQRERALRPPAHDLGR